MRKILLSVVAVSALWVALIAKADESPQVQLANLLNDLQATSGKFEQVIYSRRGATLQMTTGTFALTRPGLFRWQTLQPSPQLLIADGKKVWLYDHDLNQVSWFKEQVNNKQSPAMLLVGDIKGLAQQYNIALQHHDDQDIFRLTPKKASFFDQVQLIFNEDGLSEMVIKDNLSQTTHIQFSDLSPVANPHLFQFTPPAGADVVETAI